MSLECGQIVKSLKGHDASRLYLVIAVINDDFVLLTDGSRRSLEKPKLKRKKHLSIVGSIKDSELNKVERADIYNNLINITNQQIIKILKGY